MKFEYLGYSYGLGTYEFDPDFCLYEPTVLVTIDNPCKHADICNDYLDWLKDSVIQAPESAELPYNKVKLHILIKCDLAIIDARKIETLLKNKVRVYSISVVNCRVKYVYGDGMESTELLVFLHNATVARITESLVFEYNSKFIPRTKLGSRRKYSFCMDSVLIGMYPMNWIKAILSKAAFIDPENMGEKSFLCQVSPPWVSSTTIKYQIILDEQIQYAKTNIFRAKLKYLNFDYIPY